MIIDKIVKINVCGENIKHYNSLGYNVKHRDIIEVPIEHLLMNSHVKINCQCDICGNNRQTTYQDYNLKIKYDCKYYCCECMKEKRKMILKEKYGVENVFQLKFVINSADKTRFEKYGNLKYRNNEKIKQTNLEKYGVENVFQNEDTKNKIKTSNLEKYGVEYPQQNIEILKKSLNSGKKIIKFDNLFYQGSYEKDFISFCEKNNILYLISKPKKSIKYIFNNKVCYYHPDFYIKKLNMFIEIKSNYWWNKLLEKNLIKEKITKEQGYNYLVIMDKNYTKFQEIVLNFINR